MNTPRLTSIIILTFNELRFTKVCLEYIRRYTSEPYELVVVDNASTDGTVEYLRGQKDIKLVINDKNNGFAKGCNQGIEIAAGDYILLLNNDTAVSPGWLGNMIVCLESDQSIGIVGPRSNYVKEPQRLKVEYTTMDQIVSFSTQFNKVSDPSKWFELEMAVGFCMLIKRKVIDVVGLLDEQFGKGFFEDDDYCRRAKEKGFKIMCAGDTFVHHFGSASFIGNKIDYNRLERENWIKYNAKWHKRRVIKRNIRK
ncbi:MAG: glycosyltransferase family 2 protein [Eubacteriales bacterium]